ncbi:MAG: hypothetical protein KF726_19040 [Anaerolineae bacterium]|nr:hypothetical protein [Anaerolineae bacterium]
MDETIFARPKAEGSAVGKLRPVAAGRLARNLAWATLIIGYNDPYPFHKIAYSSIIEALDKASPRPKYKQLPPGELRYYAT